MQPYRGSYALMDSCILVQCCRVYKVSAHALFHLVLKTEQLRAGIIIICTSQEDRQFAQRCTVMCKYGWSLINPAIQCHIFYNLCVSVASSVLKVLIRLWPNLGLPSSNVRASCLSGLIRPERAISPYSTDLSADSLGELLFPSRTCSSFCLHSRGYFSFSNCIPSCKFVVTQVSLLLTRHVTSRAIII